MSPADGCRWDFSGGTSDWNASDCDGHGTHVASVAAGRTVGVAKEANVVAVKVLDCDGSGTISTVTAGKASPPGLPWPWTHPVRHAGLSSAVHTNLSSLLVGDEGIIRTSVLCYRLQAW